MVAASKIERLSMRSNETGDLSPATPAGLPSGREAGFLLLGSSGEREIGTHEEFPLTGLKTKRGEAITC
jgi:hypothetical protein